MENIGNILKSFFFFLGSTRFKNSIGKYCHASAVLNMTWSALREIAWYSNPPIYLDIGDAPRKCVAFSYLCKWMTYFQS